MSQHPSTNQQRTSVALSYELDCVTSLSENVAAESTGIKLREMVDAVPDLLAECVWMSTFKLTLCIIINADIL
jgi:hypothetical protein